MRKCFSIVVIVCALMTLFGSAAEGGARRNRTKTTKPVPVVGNTVARPGGVELQARGKATAPGTRSRRVKVVKSSCPDYQVIAQTTVIGSGSDNTKYGTYTYICNGIQHTVFGCLDQCPPGQTPFVFPPSADLIRDKAEALALNPNGTFAPPVQRDNIAAITGLRLYTSITPDTYRVVTDTLAEPGGYNANVTLTPGQVTLEANGKEATCDGPGPNPTTEEGRADSDCYVPITDVPNSGHETISITVEWTIVITSNIPGIENDEWTIERTTDLDIRIKQLQATIDT